ncbi:MAG: ribonucleoside triphosphate reductase [Spirochaetes bacterium]|jgi:anaerobic ribonucleoside-triphosphate reductase|nr:ribonucleoside triphosphate reductase [Spirochaetota bacterium]
MKPAPNSIRYIIKRDGSVVEFRPDKITEAIFNAAKAVGGSDQDQAIDITNTTVDILGIIYKEGRIPTVENVQDLVEKILIEKGHAKVAKAYILYREQHRKIRSNKDLLNEGLELVEHYLDQSDWRVNENSNMSFSLQGLNNHIASAVTAKYWLDRIYPPELSDLHKSCDLHIHDLGQLSAYCVGWDLKDLLIKGFGGVRGKIESAPPRHFRTALGQVVNFFYTLQGESAGAQAFANFDTYLAPFIRYDQLGYDRVKQCLQEFFFNMNVPTRVGFQTPFTNVTLDLTPPSTVADDYIVIGGKVRSEKYSEFQDEMDLFNKAFAECLVEGDAMKRIFTFPIPTYNISKDFDWDNEKLTPIWEMTSKYGIPYFANFINSDMSPEDARSMCCRLRLDNRELRSRGGGLFGANPLTGSIGVVTINLPRLAYKSPSKEDFFTGLAGLMDKSRTTLEIKRKVLENFTKDNLYPYTKFYLRDIFKRNGQYWLNHFSTIGLVGMNEACLNLLGETIATEKGRQFALDVLDFMRDRILGYQESTGNLYNLEATPAEGVTYRFARKDKEDFPEIITSGANEPYYTNSVHLPVNHTDDIFEILEHQDDLQVKFTGGTVVHAFLGENIDDPNMAKLLVRKIAESYRLPYFSLTPTFSICPVHGYIPGTHKFCPYEHTEEDLEQYGIEIAHSNSNDEIISARRIDTN